MFEWIVLALILLGLTLMARGPAEAQRTEKSTEPPPSFWSPRTDWQGLERPTYLRRGIALDLGQASTRRRPPNGPVVTDTATDADPDAPGHQGRARQPPERRRFGARSPRR